LSRTYPLSTRRRGCLIQDTDDILELARHLADDVLFPSANEVDVADVVPGSHFDRLADAGLYGLTSPVESGGLGLDGAPGWRVIEILAGGCLATTFVWLQHLSVASALARLDTPLAKDLVQPMCAGKVRAGIALGGARPVPSLSAVRASGGWLLNGESPWVTGWGLIDLVHVAARADDEVVWGLIDAAGSSSLRIAALRLAAVNASSTVNVTFDDHFLPDSRCTFTVAYSQWQAIDAANLRTNGSLALGVIGRCLTLLGSSPSREGADWDGHLDRLRNALDSASPEEMPEARARAAEFAVKAAAAVLVNEGSRSLLELQHGQRLLREAGFLLVFGSRPAIRASLIKGLLGPPE
jgi:alkylation response protein AidB-like acyl-CoA dehydrogenase